MRQGGGHGGGQLGGLGGGHGGGQARWRPRVPDIRAKVEPKPFTVLLNCRQFQILPTEIEVAEWFGDHLFSGQAAPLLGRVAGLDIEERDKRIMVQLGAEGDVETLLERMGEEGVAWPEFLDPVTNEPLKIRGFSADKNSLNVTLMDVPRDVEEDVIKEVMEQYGKVETVKRHHLAKQGMEHIKVNRVSVKMVKNKDAELPTTIFGLGSSTSGEERSVWRVTYPGAPRRCFRCGATSHMARDCRRPAVTMSQVEKMPGLGEEVETENQDEQQGTSFPRSFAAVVKYAKFIEQVTEKAKEAETVKQAQQAKKVEEDRRKEKEKTDKETARLDEEAKKKRENEAKRGANLARLSAEAKEAEEYKIKVQSLHHKTQSELMETRNLEKRLEMLNSGEAVPGKRLRSASTSGPAALEGGLP